MACFHGNAGLDAPVSREKRGPAPLYVPKTTFYLAMRIRRWSTIELASPIRASLDLDYSALEAHMPGFMPVYRSLEDLRKDYPDAEYFTVSGGGSP